jgi:integrase
MNMARRRGNNEGCIYRRKDGLWCAQVSLSGRRITKYGKSQKECRDWVKQMLVKIDGGLTYDGSQLTLERYAAQWLGGKGLSRKPSTVDNYRRDMERFILPALGKLRLQNIQPAHIRQLYLRMQAEGRGARTIQLVHITLHCALAQAVKEGLIGRNPLDAVERPKVETQQFQIFTEEQARQFLIAAAGSKYEAVFYLALTTGMRKGELLGLMWTDLDWDKGVLLIQRQLQQAGSTSAVLAPPKTRAGRRAIKLGHGALAQLDAHRKRQEMAKAFAGEKWQESGLIFTSGIGTFLDQSKISREFKRILEKAGLPNIRFHDLRHTSISFLLDMNTPVNTVQIRAGHSKASVTMDIYGHAMARSQEEAAERIEELVTPIPVELQ